jgi:malate synthase
LVPLAREALTRSFLGAHQLDRMPGTEATRDELLAPPRGPITEAGVRINLRVGVRYLEAWLGGQGCVVLDHQTEDVATAEIARALLWQWRASGAHLEDGRPVTDDLYDRLVAEEIEAIREEVGSERLRSGRFPQAIELFLSQVKAPALAEFLTLDAYELLP